MRIEGIVTLVFRDVNTGEITKKITAKNNVTNRWIEDYIATNFTASTTQNRGMFGPTIFISGYDIPATDPDAFKIPLVYNYGFVDAGVTSPEFFEATDTDFAYGQFQQRFSPPASLITINIIGLTPDTSINADGVAPDVQAYVKLASPCTQDTNETLDIFYRIQFPYDYYQEPSPANRDSSGVSAAMTNAMGRRLITSYNWGDYFSYVTSNYNGTIDFTKLASVPVTANTQDGYSLFQTGVLSHTDDKPLHKFEHITNMTIDKGLGSIIGFLTFGSNSQTDPHPWARGVSDLGAEVVQNIFGHGSTADKPFFDATKLNTGDGTIALDGSGWTNPDFPKLYRLNITTSGGVGAGAYQFQVRDHFGFINNTYKNPLRAVAPLMYDNRHIHDGMEFTVENPTTVTNTYERNVRPTIIRYEYTGGTAADLIAVTKTQVNVLNLNTGESIAFNSTNYPAFTATNITQVTHEADGTIYVGCRDTGIYKISTPLGVPTVTHIDNTTTGLTGLATSQCYGVHVGNSRIWAVWDGGLFSSADSGATWVQATFTNATITADWTLVKYIKADPTHADQRLCIIYESGGTTYMNLQMLWWDETTTVDVVGKQFIAFYRDVVNAYANMWRVNADEPWTYFPMIEASPTGNKWGGLMNTGTTSQNSIWYPTYFDYKAATFTNTVTNTLRSYTPFVFKWELDSTSDWNISAITSLSTSVTNYSLYKDDTTYTQSLIYSGSDALQTPTQGVIDDGAVLLLGGMKSLHWYPQQNKIHYYLFSCSEWSADGLAAHEHLLWTKYGWNGAAWEIDHAGSKTIHAASEVLSDGVNIAWDDNAGAQTFVATDYYTFGVLQGIWMDGATQIDHKTGLYMKKIVDGQTGLESGTLSASVRNSEIFQRTQTELTWQDQTSVILSTDTIRNGSTTALYDHGARSIEKITGTGITNKSAGDTLHGSFTFGLYTNMNAVTRQITAGLSPASVLGNAISPNSVHYGIQIHPQGANFLCDINIIEQGVVVASAVRVIDSIGSASYDFEVEILNDGTVNYYLWATYDSSTPGTNYTLDVRDLIYTSASTAPIVDYYADVAFNGDTSSGIVTSLTSSPRFIWQNPAGPGNVVGGRIFVSRVPDDLYHIIGDFGSSNGRYLPDFFAVDNSQNLEILIGGVAPTLILKDDIDTVLGAGEVSVFARKGFIRYSGADAGKTISANYQCLVKE